MRLNAKSLSRELVRDFGEGSTGQKRLDLLPEPMSSAQLGDG